MKRNEEELQIQIENGLVNESEDARAYQRVFEALGHEPDFHVSLPFADRVIVIIEKKEERRDYWWMAAGILLTVIALIVSIVIIRPHWNAGVFTFISGYAGLAIFGVAFILLLNWVDKKVIKKQIRSL